MNHYRRQPDVSDFTAPEPQNARREIFVNGILGHTFQRVFDSLGELEAIEWGERCLHDSDVTTSSGTYPLSGFPFQKTYALWRAQNQDRAKQAMAAIKERDEKRRMIATQNHVPKPKSKSKSKK